MKETGRVVSVNDTQCEVIFTRSSACESCGACRRMDGQEMRVQLENRLQARVGDTVRVELGARNLLGASAWAYIFPLLMLFLGVGLGTLVKGAFGLASDVLPALCGLLFTVCAFLILKKLDRVFSKKKGFAPQIVEIVCLAEQPANINHKGV